MKKKQTKKYPFCTGEKQINQKTLSFMTIIDFDQSGALLNIAIYFLTEKRLQCTACTLHLEYNGKLKKNKIESQSP